MRCGLSDCGADRGESRGEGSRVRVHVGMTVSHMELPDLSTDCLGLSEEIVDEEKERNKQTVGKKKKKGHRRRRTGEEGFKVEETLLKHPVLHYSSQACFRSLRIQKLMLDTQPV